MESSLDSAEPSGELGSMNAATMRALTEEETRKWEALETQIASTETSGAALETSTALECQRAADRLREAREEHNKAEQQVANVLCAS
jgi:hypothetical protein